jgi:adenylate cyclase
MAIADAEAPRRWFRIPVEMTRRHDEEQARANPLLAEALAREKHQGQRQATIARTVALGIIALLIPFLNLFYDNLYFSYGTLYYEGLIAAFVATGFLQLHFARVGRSRIELALIVFDLALLTYICIWPNPFVQETVPGAFPYRFGNFSYFFVLLAVATLAYSWRTIWTIGIVVPALWLGAAALIAGFGKVIPELTVGAQAAFAGHPVVLASMDPNDLQFPTRLQEAVLFLIVAGALALKGWRANRLVMQQSEIAAERANLSRYFPPDRVELLASRRRDAAKVGSQYAAVLFADIVGFTNIAETLAPARVMDLLRGFHAVIESAIFENGGTLDKYLGDGVMATFGTPQAGRRDASNAFAAARRIIADIDRYAAQRAGAGDPPFRVSVGVHYGAVIVGDIGPARRLEFAVLGDAVNVAARLEAATRELACRMIASAELVGQMKNEGGVMPPGFRLHRKVSLKGRAKPVDLWVDLPSRRNQAGATTLR